MSANASIRAVASSCVESARVFLRDVGAGLLEVSHNSLALLGLLVLGAALFAGGREDIRTAVEREALDWLLARQEARDPQAEDTQPEPEPDAVARATAADPKALPRQQAAVASWLSRRYKVAPEPVSRLVQEAWSVGHRVGLDPTLILAIMAVESSFNPFAQSAVGAQGLMQVMTRVHDDKYEAYGGVRAAFDPVANLRVGVQVLKECIARAGGLEAGLRFYVGAALSGEDGGYVGKVLAEQGHLRQVADGRKVSVSASNTPAASGTGKGDVPALPTPPSAAPSAPAGTDERVALR
ncbi:MAG TPA: lytic transglycosylase domain-containing protein [Aquabacterium sp.]|nr:lytic transglycosylase domain-containing protein [Aquabacterium sp.]HQC95939.1 lytic transglycosylase domain-containing protein [Aquabacterium sp.]